MAADNRGALGERPRDENSSMDPTSMTIKISYFIRWADQSFVKKNCNCLHKYSRRDYALECVIDDRGTSGTNTSLLLATLVSMSLETSTMKQRIGSQTWIQHFPQTTELGLCSK